MSARPDPRIVPRWLAAAVAVLVPLACGGDDDDGGGGGDDTAVQPFAEVQADDFRFEVDATNPERAIFHVTTTEPMICAIVWGPTEEFGNFHNSLAMNGTGITEHDVFLPGVEPGATYFFRVQGSTADGTLYQSETATFTIPATAAAAPAEAGPQQENLALAATVADVSSEFSEGFAAANAVDDSGTTEWSSAGDGDDAFIVLDLGAPREIAGVEFITRSMADGSAVAETFTVSVDDETFGPFPAGTPVDPATAAVSATGQLVRFDVESSTGGNTGAVEIRVLAP